MDIGVYIIAVILLGLSGAVVLLAIGWSAYEVYKLIKMDLSIKDLSDIDD